jgi:peptide/nickel transport system ATP-binding protein
VTTPPLLEVENLKVYYRTRAGPVKAVDGVSFKIDGNEMLGIVGESGCGKSTLGTALMKLTISPAYVEAGRVMLEGRDLLSLDEETLREVRWRNISWVPQSSMNALNPILRIRDQIGDAISAHENVSRDGIAKRVAETLDLVGLSPDVSKMFPHELSGGMKQRVVIAMAIVLKPKICILDEPTTALDVVVQRGVLQSIKDISETLGMSSILITHDIAVQAQMAERLAVIYAGKIVEIGKSDTLFHDPLHPYTRALMDATPSLGKKTALKGLEGFPPNLLNPPAGCRFHPRCSLVSGRCTSEEPTLCEIEPGHFVACAQFRR